jgi:predicted Zn-dependent protease
MLAVLLWSAVPAQAQGQQLIRDAEIESMIRDFATPIWKAAHLDADHVQVNIVQDKTLNAFVAGGQRIFVNTGTITAADTPNQVIGVLAHETGHITGGHLARTQEALAKASTLAIVTMLAGVAALAAGGGDAGAAIMMSSSGLAGRNFLAYSRTQESSADQAGLGFLTATHQSARGLIEFFQKLQTQQNLLVEGKADPYIQSHPLTQQRIAALETNAQASPYWNAKDTPENIEKLKRAKAKIIGYMEPKRALQVYKKGDPSLEARYARAFALYRQSLTDDALTLIDGLIEERPNDPYFYELKGQILFEAGKADAAKAPLSKAVSNLPNEPLMRILYAQVLLADSGTQDAEGAIRNLKAAALVDKEDPNLWHLMAQAYHTNGNEAMADLSTAEQYLLTGQAGQAVHLANRALRGLERDTPSWWRANDIVYIAESNGIGQQQRRDRR